MTIGSLKITATSIYVNGKITMDPTTIGNELLHYVQKTKTNIEGSEELLNNYLKERNSRKTPERAFVLKAIHQIDGPFSVDSLYYEMTGKDRVCKATIYNTLKLFLKIGLINKTNNAHSLSNGNEFEINYLNRN